MTKEATGADFKSATELETKKLFIETYGCQMNVAPLPCPVRTPPRRKGYLLPSWR